MHTKGKRPAILLCPSTTQREQVSSLRTMCSPKTISGVAAASAVLARPETPSNRTISPRPQCSSVAAPSSECLALRVSLLMTSRASFLILARAVSKNTPTKRKQIGGSAHKWKTVSSNTGLSHVCSKLHGRQDRRWSQLRPLCYFWRAWRQVGLWVLCGALSCRATERASEGASRLNQAFDRNIR